MFLFVLLGDRTDIPVDLDEPIDISGVIMGDKMMMEGVSWFVFVAWRDGDGLFPTRRTMGVPDIPAIVKTTSHSEEGQEIPHDGISIYLCGHFFRIFFKKLLLLPKN